MKKLLTVSALALVLGGVGSLAAQAQETINAPVRAHVVSRHVIADRQALAEMRQDAREARAQRWDNPQTELYSSEDVSGLDSRARAAYEESLNAQYLFGNPEDGTNDGSGAD